MNLFTSAFGFSSYGLQIYFDQNQGGTGGSGGSGSNSNAQVTALQERINKLNAQIDTLQTENYKLREDRRTLRTQVGELEKSVPKEGEIVLPKTEAELWQSYQGIGKPDDLSKQLAELGKLRRDVLVRRVADTHGYQSQVLGTLLPSDAQVEVRGVKDEEGKTKQVAYLKLADGQEQLITDYAEANWKPFMPALVTNNNHPQGGNQAGGPAWFNQGGGSEPKPPSGEGDLVTRRIQQQNQKRDETLKNNPII